MKQRDVFGAVASIAAARHGEFTRIEAASSGLTAHHIATLIGRGIVSEPVKGVLVVAGSRDSWRRRLAVTVAAGHPYAAAAMRASTVLHRLGLFDDPDDWGAQYVPAQANVRRLGPVRPSVPAEALTVQPHWYHVPDGYGAVLHQAATLPPDDVVVIDGIRCTNLARTLCDLGAVCTDEEVWQALITARRVHDVSPAWLSATATRLDRPGPTGASTIRRLLRRWADEGVLPESVFEDILTAMLADAALPPVVRQHTIRDVQGRFIARVDAAIPAARLAIEAHSRRFHFGPIREAADEDRDLQIAAAGYEVLYLGWYATRTAAATMAAIRPIVLDRLARFAESA